MSVKYGTVLRQFSKRLFGSSFHQRLPPASRPRPAKVNLKLKLTSQKFQSFQEKMNCCFRQKTKFVVILNFPREILSLYFSDTMSWTSSVCRKRNKHCRIVVKKFLSQRQTQESFPLVSQYSHFKNLSIIAQLIPRRQLKNSEGPNPKQPPRSCRSLQGVSSSQI